MKNLGKATQKYLDIIASGSIEESQIISLRSLINNNKEARHAIFDALGDKDDLDLSASQNQKGITFLLAQWKTPRGIERKNNPFGYREQHVLENFKDFTLHGFYDAGNMFCQNYLPVYSCNATDGSGFEYYYNNGKVHIIG